MGRGPVASVLVLLLVLSVVATPVAAADDTTTKVYESVNTLIDALNCTQLTAWLAPGCIPDLDISFADGDAETVHNDIYNDAAVTTDVREQVTTAAESHLNQSFGIGMSRAKLDIIQNLNANNSSSQAQTAAQNEVEDFYSAQQYRLVQARNRDAVKLKNAVDKVNATSGLSYSDVFKTQFNGDASVTTFVFDTVNFTLHNGTTVAVKNVTINGPDMNKVPLIPVSLSTAANPYGSQCDSSDRTELQSSNPYDSDLNMFVDVKDYCAVARSINDRESQATQNVATMANEVYANYEPGELSVSDTLGPLETLGLASTNYADTGFYAYLALSLEQAGLAHNSSYAFKLQWNNDPGNSTTVKNATGQLFVEEGAYNGTIEVNTTYNASDVYASFVHAVDGGAATETELTGTFTVLEMTDKSTGETVNSTSIQSTEFRTASTSDLAAQLQEFRDVQNRLEELVNSIGGGGLLNGSLWDELFPNVPNPFAGIADALGISETAAAGLSVFGLLLLIAFL